MERSGQTTDALFTTQRLLATKTTDMADGFGTAFSLNIQDNAAVINLLGYIGAVRAGADNTGNIVLRPVSGGSTISSFTLSPTTGLTLLHDLVVQGNDIDGLTGTFNFLATPTTIVEGALCTTYTVGKDATNTINRKAATIASGLNALTLFNTSALTVTAFGAATALTFGAATGTCTINNAAIKMPNMPTANTGANGGMWVDSSADYAVKMGHA
jgi:hypothetical protein